MTQQATVTTFFILTGEPGVGKTTLIKKICSILSTKGVKTFGFYTEEVRDNRVRQGFDVVSLDGARARLARDQGLLPTRSKICVGKYAVFVQDFEAVALPSLIKPTEIHNHCIVIDEIGKMELFSNIFKSKIEEIFNQCSNNIVLATIPIRKSEAIIESIRSNPKSKIWTVTRENRSTEIHKDILNEMQKFLKFE